MKRFTETQKWDDPWFRALSPDAKLIWFWLLDKCDGAGVIDPDFALCEFQTGVKRAFDKMPELESRLATLENGKLLVVKFIEFQQGKLSHDCKAHKPIFDSLKRNGMMDENGEMKGYQKGIHTLSKGYPMGLSNIKGNGNENSNTLKKEKTEKPTIDDVRVFCKEVGMPESVGDFCFWKWEGNGWTNGGKPIKNWKATIRSWKAAGHLPPKQNTKSGGTYHDRHHGETEEITNIPF